MYKLYGKWDLAEVEVTDLGIKRYANLDPVILPHSSGRHARQQFNKSNLLIVERLVNSMMRGKKNTGKKQIAMRTVEDALEIINTKTKRTPSRYL